MFKFCNVSPFQNCIMLRTNYINLVDRSDARFCNVSPFQNCIMLRTNYINLVDRSDV